MDSRDFYTGGQKNPHSRCNSSLAAGRGLRSQGGGGGLTDSREVGIIESHDGLRAHGSERHAAGLGTHGMDAR